MRRAPSSTRRRVGQVVASTLETLESRDLLAAGPLGLNLSSIDFVDVLKQSTGDPTAAGQAPLSLDSHGWPTVDASILLIDDRVNQAWNGPDPNAAQPDIGGTYHLSFHGQATIGTPWNRIFTVQNQTYDPASNVTNADLVVTHNAYPFFQLQFTNTQNTESSTGAGVSQVQLLHPVTPPGRPRSSPTTS